MIRALDVSYALLIAACAFCADWAFSEARVESFSPTGYAKDVRQVAVRFSEAMVALGEPERSVPFDVDCEVPGYGRWIDERHWVYDFDHDVPGAVRCRFSLGADVRTLAGGEVVALTEYAFHTGGPAIVDWEAGWRRIDERQVFLLALDAVAEGDSIRAHVHCKIPGSDANLPVDLLQGAERSEVLDALEAAGDYHVEPLVEKVSRYLRTANKDETQARALERIVMVRCRDPLPGGTDIELIWGAGVAGLNGMTTTREHALTFSVRPDFRAQLRCEREFEDRCVGGIYVEFTAPVARELAGRLRLVDENGDVVPGEMLFGRYRQLHRPPEIDRIDFREASDDQTSYRAELVGPITDVDGRALANAASFPSTIQVDRLPPGASFGDGFRVVERDTGAVAPVMLRRIDEPLAGQRHLVVDDADIVAWMRRVETARNETELWDKVAAERSVFEAVSGDTFTLSGSAEEPYQIAGIPLPGPGFHVVELELPAAGTLPRRYVAGLVLVTDLSIHVHRGRESTLVWVTGLSGGQPVEGADIAISESCGGQVVARAVTNAEGVATVPGSLPWHRAASSKPDCGASLESNRRADFRYLVSARKDGDLAVTTSGYRSELELRPMFKAHAILDRALYQPGETVSVKLVVRHATSDGLIFPGALATKAKVTIEHFGTDESQEATVDIAEDGSAVASFDLPTNAKLGDYDVDVEVDGRRVRVRGEFRVERFRVGTMRATVDGPTGPLVSTGSIPVTLSVEHLAGGAAMSLPVSVRTTVRPYSREHRTPPEPHRTSVTLDRTGKARLAIPAPPLEGKSALDVEMDYRDANGQLKTASERFELWPAAIELIVSGGWEAEGDKGFGVQARRIDGTVAPGVPVEARIYAPRYVGNGRLPGGFRGSVRLAESRLLGTCSGRTDADGVLACDAPAEAPARVFVAATAQDEDGNDAKTADTTYFYERTRAWVRIGEERRYEVGETVPIELDLPFDESTVLVTVHREGVLAAFTERVKGPKAVVNVPVRGNFAPNVEVSVLAVRPRIGSRDLRLETPRPVGPDYRMADHQRPDFRLGKVEVPVGRGANTLSVRVEPDRVTYRTRERARVRIAVAGPGGRPRPDAEVALVAVDEGLLDLWPNQTWDILDAMMEERYAGVVTTTSMRRLVPDFFARGGVETVIVIGSYVRSPLDEFPMDEEPTLRERFDALLLWRDRLAMDETGSAAIEIPLNDLLTSFRIVAIATAGADLFGTGEATIRTTQDLVLHAGLPEVVRTGDRFDAVFNLRNASSTRHRVSVVAEVDGIGKLRRKRLTLRPGESRQVSWPVTVPTGTEQLDWVATAKGGSASDGLSVRQRVESAVPVRVLQATLPVGEAPGVAGQRPGHGGTRPGRRQGFSAIESRRRPRHGSRRHVTVPV